MYSLLSLLQLQNTATINMSNAVSQLLKTNDVDVNFQDEYGNCALHYACQYDNIDMVKTLLLFGADINLYNAFGNNALLIALQKGYLEIATFLMSQIPNKDLNNY